MKKLLHSKKKESCDSTDVGKRYGNLDEVMNFTVPFELIYSGVENESYFNILYGMGVRNFLMSYHYIQTKHINMSRFDSLDNVRLFIDSGAHTYQNDPKYSEYGLDYWEDHLQKYLKWAERNKKYIFAIASFDFENLVGGEVVDQWNKKYFEPFMLRTGIPVCFVWHQNSYNSWEYYCKRYPYVGFSSVNTEGVAIDLPEYSDKIRTAEKNNSLVHGFGMTRTSMLTELPFYSSDSTTWLVGLQYGEVNYWNGSKMSRLKKDAWKTNFLDDICSRYGLNKEKFLAEDTTELIKANIGAFMDAENYVQTRLKHRMYWLKAKTTSVDLDNLPDDFFPPPEWFEGDMKDIADYCKKMNLNPDYEGVSDLLHDVTAFLNWDNPDYADFVGWYREPEQDNLIDELHDYYINRIVPDKETKIADLIAFFRDCVSGNNDKLLQLGTNFDRTIKEREIYIEEDNTELVDLPMSEIKKRLHNLLPDKSFEDDGSDITALDEEIYRQAEIVPTFDEHGKFIKGQTEVRKPKQVYSKKFPKLACDTCFAAAKCPEYKSGYVCAYNKMFNRFSTRDMGDIIQGIQGIVEFNMQRMQKSMIMETINGTVDPTTTQLMEANVRYLNMLRSMYENGSSEVLKQTRIVRSDGTTEETTSITNPQSGGIMEKLFSSLSSGKKEEPPVVDTTASEGDSK